MVSYSNPVWPGYMADPFVLRHEGVYYAYGTSGGGTLANGREFQLLRSADLVHWDDLGGALEPLANGEGEAQGEYWAPEVAFRDGVFYMYYSSSVGQETQRLRCATCGKPEGPFIDSGGLLLPDEGFSIDPHPFRDPKDGQWYLFFARDYLDDGRIGTGTAVVPLGADMKPAGAVVPVLRASHDWQIFERDRTMYDQKFDSWHTVEGPFIVVRDGLYYCLYSGGAWTSAGYGVGYGVASHPLGPWRDEWAHEGASVLKGVPGEVLGPGHNSVVLGPDGTMPFVVYHAWDLEQTARRMCIDPLIWTSDNRPRCLGPTTKLQPLPTSSDDASA